MFSNYFSEIVKMAVKTKAGLIYIELFEKQV